jgi:hypothetical protein
MLIETLCNFTSTQILDFMWKINVMYNVKKWFYKLVLVVLKKNHTLVIISTIIMLLVNLFFTITKSFVLSSCPNYIRHRTKSIKETILHHWSNIGLHSFTRSITITNCIAMQRSFRSFKKHRYKKLSWEKNDESEERILIMREVGWLKINKKCPKSCWCDHMQRAKRLLNVHRINIFMFECMGVS